jgi:solute carrier family 25 (mitochondrial folate transporter), member 32
MSNAATGTTSIVPGQQPSSRLIPSSTVPLVSGFVAGVASTLFLTPLDVVKLRLQVTESAKPDAKFRFFRIFGGIVKYEGVIGLYAGLAPAVVGSAVSWGGYFFFYEQLKKGLADFKRSRLDPTHNSHHPPMHPSQILNSFDNFILACASGMIMVPLTNPIWLIKTRMQLQMRNAETAAGVKPYRNMWDAARTIVRDESFAALYKGSGAAILLTSHGGVQFVVYEYLRKHSHYQRLSREESDGLNVWRRLELSAGFLAMGGIAKLYVHGEG